MEGVQHSQFATKWSIGLHKNECYILGAQLWSLLLAGKVFTAAVGDYASDTHALPPSLLPCCIYGQSCTGC